MTWHNMALDAYFHSLYLMKYSVSDFENQKLIILLVAAIVPFYLRVMEWVRTSTDTLFRRAEGYVTLAERWGVGGSSLLRRAESLS